MVDDIPRWQRAPDAVCARCHESRSARAESSARPAGKKSRHRTRRQARAPRMP